MSRAKSNGETEYRENFLLGYKSSEAPKTTVARLCGRFQAGQIGTTLAFTRRAFAVDMSGEVVGHGLGTEPNYSARAPRMLYLS